MAEVAFLPDSGPFFWAAVESWKDDFRIPTIVAAVVAGLVANELLAVARKIALALVRLSTLLLPSDQRDRWRQEWEADLRIFIEEGHRIGALIWSFGLPVAAARQARLRERSTGWALSEESDSAAIGIVSGVVLGPVFGLAAHVLLALADNLHLYAMAGLSVGLGCGMLAGVYTGAVYEQARARLANGLVAGSTAGPIAALVSLWVVEPPSAILVGVLAAVLATLVGAFGPAWLSICGVGAISMETLTEAFVLLSIWLGPAPRVGGVIAGLILGGAGGLPTGWIAGKLGVHAIKLGRHFSRVLAWLRARASFSRD